MQPTPSSSVGTIRITYERDLDDLDIPRGIIGTITGGTATQFTSITLDTTADAYETTSPGWNTQQYCCLVDPFGARKCANVLIGSYVAGTNVLTPSPSPYTYATTTPSDSALAVGDVAVFNKYTTTFSQLPDACERYLIHSAAAELFHRDSSKDYGKEKDIVAEIEEDVLRALAAQTSEVQLIPQSDRYEWF